VRRGGGAKREERGAVKWHITLHGGVPLTVVHLNFPRSPGR
jgi:hypothetical protein